MAVGNTSTYKYCAADAAIWAEQQLVAIPEWAGVLVKAEERRFTTAYRSSLNKLRNAVKPVV